MTTAEAIRDAELTAPGDDFVDRLHADIAEVLRERPREEVQAELERGFERYDRSRDSQRRDAVGLVLDCLEGFCSPYAAL